MILVAAVDFRRFIIPNVLVAIGLAAGVLRTVFDQDASWSHLLLSGLGAILLMFFVRAAGNRVFKKESMGMGDGGCKIFCV